VKISKIPWIPSHLLNHFSHFIYIRVGPSLFDLPTSPGRIWCSYAWFATKATIISECDNIWTKYCKIILTKATKCSNYCVTLYGVLHLLLSPLLTWTKSSDNCLVELRWQVSSWLPLSWSDNIIHKRVEFCSFVSSATRRHPHSIIPLQTTINSFWFSFLGNMPFLWNKIPFNINFKFTLSNRNVCNELQSYVTSFVSVYCFVCSVLYIANCLHCCLYLLWRNTLVQA